MQHPIENPSAGLVREKCLSSEAELVEAKRPPLNRKILDLGRIKLPHLVIRKLRSDGSLQLPQKLSARKYIATAPWFVLDRLEETVRSEVCTHVWAESSNITM